jgi:hypothetical protein
MDGEVDVKMILCKNMKPRWRNVAAGSGCAGEEDRSPRELYHLKVQRITIQ